MALVLASGRAPQPPPAFDASTAAEGEFAPPLAKAAKADVPPACPKVLASGQVPKPPPAFDAAAASGSAEWSHPLDEKKAPAGAAAPEKPPRPPALPTVPKVLSTGHKPQPPPSFADDTAAADWNPPLEAT